MSKFGIGRCATTIGPLVAGDAHNTIAVRYHSTNVVLYNDSHITLDSGGYKTVTTKRRMNEASTTMGLDYQVYQVNFDWFVSFRGKNYVFRDNMILDRLKGLARDRDGNPLSPLE